MKKISSFLIIILLCSKCYAQPASLTVTNNAPTGCSVTVTMYASATFGGYAASCSQYVSNSFTLAGGGTSITWCDPTDFENGVSCSSPTHPDWAISPAGDFTSTPSNFQWNGASFFYSGSGCPTGTGCIPNYSNTGIVTDGCIGTTCPASFLGSSYTWGNSLCPPYVNYAPACGFFWVNALIRFW